MPMVVHPHGGGEGSIGRSPEALLDCPVLSLKACAWRLRPCGPRGLTPLVRVAASREGVGSLGLVRSRRWADVRGSRCALFTCSPHALLSSVCEGCPCLCVGVALAALLKGPRDQQRMPLSKGFALPVARAPELCDLPEVWSTFLELSTIPAF